MKNDIEEIFCQIKGFECFLQRIVLSLLFSSLKDNFCEKDEPIGVKLSLTRGMKLFKDNSCEKMLSLRNELSLIKRNMLTKDNLRYLTTYSERL